jgi:5-methylcytosine-specific restriction protein B
MGKEYTLESTLNKKVIPLLLEYFMNSEEQVKEILASAGIAIGGWPLKMIQ